MTPKEFFARKLYTLKLLWQAHIFIFNFIKRMVENDRKRKRELKNGDRNNLPKYLNPPPPPEKL